jgi:hypothetical protein
MQKVIIDEFALKDFFFLFLSSTILICSIFFCVLASTEINWRIFIDMFYNRRVVVDVTCVCSQNLSSARDDGESKVIKRQLCANFLYSKEKKNHDTLFR